MMPSRSLDSGVGGGDDLSSYSLHESLMLEGGGGGGVDSSAASSSASSSAATSSSSSAASAAAAAAAAVAASPSPLIGLEAMERQAVLADASRLCAFCNLGDRSLLGQGTLTRYEPTPGFSPFRMEAAAARRKRTDDLRGDDATQGRERGGVGCRCLGLVLEFVRSALFNWLVDSVWLLFLPGCPPACSYFPFITLLSSFRSHPHVPPRPLGPPFKYPISNLHPCTSFLRI